MSEPGYMAVARRPEDDSYMRVGRPDDSDYMAVRRADDGTYLRVARPDGDDPAYLSLASRPGA